MLSLNLVETAILDGKLEDSQFFLERYGRYSLVSEAFIPTQLDY